MADPYAFVGNGFPTTGGSGTTRTATVVSTGAAGSILVGWVCLTNPASSVVLTGVSGSANTWGILEGSISPGSGALTGDSMAMVYCIVTNPSAAETVTFTFSASPASFDFPYILVKRLSDTRYSWYVDNAQGIFESFNTSPGVTVNLFQPACSLAAGEVGVYGIICNVAVANFGGWNLGYGGYSSFVGILADTNLGNSTGVPQWIMGSAGSVFALGCVFRGVPSEIPECVSAMGVM